MSNGTECCALGPCCPPGSAEQRNALVKIVVRDTTCDEAEAGAMVDALKNAGVAFAPKSIEPFIAEIVQMAKKRHDA